MVGLADRLLSRLRDEIATFERQIKDDSPIDDAAGTRHRFDAIAQMTKLLEKLLDLKRLERSVVCDDGEEGPEARRMQAEMMKRLRALDRRREAGAGLFAGPAKASG